MRRLTFGLCSLILLSISVLTACSSGGGSSSAPTLSGVAATGGPLSGAAITVYDKTGTAVVTSTTGSDGSYSVTLPATAQGPFVVQATRDDIGTMVSVLATAGSTNNTVNISPVTNLIASRLSPSGDPTKLTSEIVAGTATVTDAALQAKVTEILAILQPLQQAVGDTTTNPITDSSFKANGTGQDKVLDLIKIAIAPSGSNTANVQIAISGQVSDISFQSGLGAVVAPPVTAPAIDSTVLPPAAINVQAQIADFQNRATACLALPAGQRADSTGKLVAACSNLFWNNDPATYKHNGKSAAKAFIDYASDSTTNTKFDTGVFEYIIADRSSTFSSSPYVITIRVTAPDGSVSYSTQVLMADPNDGNRFKLIGNQWDYDAKVRPFAEYREFPNQPQYTYADTGYELSIQAGQPTGATFNRVEVTTPLITNGSGTPSSYKFTLKPKSGLSYLSIAAINGAPVNTSTNLIRLNGAYADVATAGTPNQKDTGLVWYPGLISDAIIGGFPLRSVWTFEYFLTGNTSATADAVEKRTTLTRAPTVAEAKAMTWAKLISPLSTAILSTSGLYPTPSTGVPFSWEVPTGATAPNYLQVYGSNFNDTLNVTSSARQGTVICSSQGAADTHCVSGGYAVNTVANLLAIDTFNTSRNITLFRRYVLYKLN